MSCRKCKEKCCVCEQGPRGPRGFSGASGQPGVMGVTGPTGEAGGFRTPDFVPAYKELGATFYDNVSPVEVVGPGDIFPFSLDGPNDPIGRLDSGTFILPFVGLYKIDFQIPINEPTPAQVAGGAYVQASLTAQTIPEGAFIPVPGGIVGKAAQGSQLIGSVIAQATRDNFPVRVENTSNIPVSYVAGNLAVPNQRTINIISLLPLRIDVFGWMLKRGGGIQDLTTAAPGSIVLFNVTSGARAGNQASGQTSNVDFLPLPFPTRMIIQSSGPVVLKWFVLGRPVDFETPTSDITRFFAPFVNDNQLLVESTGFTTANLAAGDEITLRNISGMNLQITQSAPVTAPNLPTTQAVLQVYSLNL